MFRRLWMLTAAIGLSLTMAGPATAQDVFTGLKPAAIDGQSVDPGLAVTYWRGNNYPLMIEYHDLISRSPGQLGDPVLQLDTGNTVLTTKSTELVAAVMKGLINFAEAGTYQVEFVSNDGILVEIDGQLVHADPNRHSDSTSGPIPVEITEPGWYDLDIAYFQKKGTHRHEMYWLPPSQQGELTLVPAEVFAHLPGTEPGFETMPVPDPEDTFIR